MNLSCLSVRHIPYTSKPNVHRARWNAIRLTQSCVHRSALKLMANNKSLCRRWFRRQNVIAAFFHKLLRGDRLSPGDWNREKLRVIFKMGDASVPFNYVPIIIPVMAQLFSIGLSGKKRLWMQRCRACAKDCSREISGVGSRFFGGNLGCGKGLRKGLPSGLGFRPAETPSWVVAAPMQFYFKSSGYVALRYRASRRGFDVHTGERQGDLSTLSWMVC